MLTRQGAQEYGLRFLSEGPCLGIITTRSIAESVIGAQLLKALRERGIDIDSLAEHLHRSVDPEATSPSKSEGPSAFMAPVIQAVVSKLKRISPAKQDTAALRELQAVQKVKETEAKLRQTQQPQSSQRIPTTPDDTAVAEPNVSDPIEPFDSDTRSQCKSQTTTSFDSMGEKPRS